MEFFVDTDPHMIREETGAPIFKLETSINLQLPSSISRLDCSTFDLEEEKIAIAGHLLNEPNQPYIWTFKLDFGNQKPEETLIIKEETNQMASSLTKLTCGSLCFIKKLQNQALLLYVCSFEADSSTFTL